MERICTHRWMTFAGACAAALGVGAAAASRSVSDPSVVSVPYLAFAANPASLGPIPDGVSNVGGSFGSPRDVTFTVSGITRKVLSVRVSLTLAGPFHTVVGDLDVTLISPGGVRSLVVFSRTGATTALGFGDNSDCAGPYTFADSAAGTGWWQAATAAGPTTAIPSGTYRTTAPGGAGQADPAPATSLDATFVSLMPAQANGTWTLRFRDGLVGATGSVSAATLEIALAAGPFDFDGDGISDPAVVRDTSGVATWYVRRSSDEGLLALTWGFTSDVRVPADYDGDGRVDISVWRSDASAIFYTMQSSDGTVQATQWGTTNDTTRGVGGDYDGDGKDDLVVVRTTTGIWYVRRSSDGAMLAQPFPYGAVAPGDYDGDGRADFANRSSGIFHLLQSTAGYTAIPWGLGTDAAVRGDYDGDGKDDVAVVRNENGTRVWYIRQSGDGSLLAAVWGLAPTDGMAPADYDGDGRADIAVVRNEGPLVWYIRRSADGGLTVIPWGLGGDGALPNVWVH
jgi:subtilisin-like proprotein convertase family protein